MIFRLFIFILFLLKTNDEKRNLDENDFRYCYCNFSNAIMKVTQSQLCLKFFLKNYEAYWQQHFERHPTTEDFTDMEKHTF